MARSWSDKLFSSRKKDKWRPDKWDHDKVLEINGAFADVRRATDRFREAIRGEEVDATRTYGILFESVEKLYSLTEMDKLAMDAQRRNREVKKLVERNKEK